MGHFVINGSGFKFELHHSSVFSLCARYRCRHVLCQTHDNSAFSLCAGYRCRGVLCQTHHCSELQLCVAGIEAELYYVRDGIINNYALSFNLPINANIEDIYFTWQSLRDNPQVSGCWCLFVCFFLSFDTFFFFSFFFFFFFCVPMYIFGFRHSW